LGGEIIMVDISFYEKNIKKFLEKEISIDKFQTMYFDFFKNSTESLEYYFPTLDKLFCEIDCYTTDKKLLKMKPDFYLNEDQLRNCAKSALHSLEEINRSLSKNVS
jgi:hypothetical protein